MQFVKGWGGGGGCGGKGGGRVEGFVTHVENYDIFYFIFYNVLT